MKLETCFCSFIRHNTGALLVSAPLNTDRSLSTELVDPRRQVPELQRTLAHAEQGRAVGHTSALDAAQVGTWEWEGSTNRVLWSAETETIFGITPGSFDGTYEGFFALVHPDDRQQLGAAIAKGVEDRTPYRIEHRIITPEGSVRWVACRGHATFREHEPVTGMAGTIENITARKELELAQQDFRETLERQIRERTATLEQTITDLKKEAERRLKEIEKRKQREQKKREEKIHAEEAWLKAVKKLKEAKRRARELKIDAEKKKKKKKKS